MKRMLAKILVYDDLGRQKVLGRIFGVVSQALMMFTFLKVYGIKLAYWQMTVIIAGWFVCEIGLGWFYYNKNIIQEETDIYNEKNQILMKWNREHKNE